jgi:hypothetical protein
LKNQNADFFIPKTDVCPGSKPSFKIPLAGANYLWTANNNQFAPITTQEAEIPASAIVTLTVSDASTCTYTETFEVFYKPVPIAPNFLVTQKAQLTDTIVVVDISEVPLDQYEWSVSGASKILDQTRDYAKFIVDTAGTYTFKQTSIRNGCFVSSSRTIKVVDDGKKDVQFNSKNNQLTVYPNPSVFGSDINLKIQTANKKPATIRVIDLLGNIYYTQEIQDQTDYTIALPASAFSAPDKVYIVSLITESTVINTSLIVRSTN